MASSPLLSLWPQALYCTMVGNTIFTETFAYKCREEASWEACSSSTFFLKRAGELRINILRRKRGEPRVIQLGACIMPIHRTPVEKYS